MAGLARKFLKVPYIRRNGFSGTTTREKKHPFDLNAVLANHEQYTKRATALGEIHEDLAPFTMILPPPNVTGNLHLGHALTVTIEDSLCRHKRLYGHKAIWHPGFDHAGIATQVIVEKNLWQQKKLLRNQISREEFLEQCEEWKNRRVTHITRQLNMLGATLDWSRQYYTMDPQFAYAVTMAFCQLYAGNLVFNDYRMVNWCPALQSTISDQEVDIITAGNNAEVEIASSGFEKRILHCGLMHRIRYYLVDSNSYLEAATTRPETVFADMALAVHPSDARYSRYINSHVQHPLIDDRTLPVLADTAVNPDKGTGILKITPAHDFLDFQIYERHSSQLEGTLQRKCIDKFGKLINAADFDGLDRFEARDKVIQRLKEIRRYGGVMQYGEQEIRVCSRTGDVIEPMLKRQWFMNCEAMNELALKSLSEGKVVVTPKNLLANLEEWLHNKEPWCLSRQLDWGHRIPAYRNKDTEHWIVGRNLVEAMRNDGKTCCATNYQQDEDVLDTWFCSALIPIVIAGWPTKKVESAPLTLMETGHDIVGFWVARMLTVCQSLTGCLPFTKIMLHGLVRDEKRRKMSKSLGNVIDPLDVIEGISLSDMLNRVSETALSSSEKEQAFESLKTQYPDGIRRCGPDALRFALLRHDVTSVDINMDIKNTAEEGLRFCNKLWNMFAYAQEVWINAKTSKDETLDRIEKSVRPSNLQDKWIMSRLQSTLLSVNVHMELLCPHLAFESLRKFLWNDLCDIYLETTKKSLWSADHVRLKHVGMVLQHVFEKSITQLSVFMPFVSEYLLDRMTRDFGFTLDRTFAKEEIGHGTDKQLECDMQLVIATISAIRNLRQQFGLSPKKTLPVFYLSSTKEMEDFSSLISEMSNVTFNSDALACAEKRLFPFPIPGSESEIKVQLEENSSVLVRNALNERLEKALRRKAQFQSRSNRNELFAQNAKKASQAEVFKRKAEQAKVVVSNLDAEVARIRLMIDSL